MVLRQLGAAVVLGTGLNGGLDVVELLELPGPGDLLIDEFVKQIIVVRLQDVIVLLFQPLYLLVLLLALGRCVLVDILSISFHLLTVTTGFGLALSFALLLPNV